MSLSPGGLLSGVTWTGVLRGNTLTLTVPQGNGLLATIVLKAATVEDYNKAVIVLRNRISRLAEQYALQRQHEAELAARRTNVINASDALALALQELVRGAQQLSYSAREAEFSQVMSSYREHSAAMQRHYQELQTDAAKRPVDCVQLSTVQVDLSTLEVDMSSIQVDNGSFDVVRSPISNEIVQLGRAEARTRTALANVQAAVAANLHTRPGLVVVYLENRSSGTTSFMVDGGSVCNANPGEACEVDLNDSILHHLSAETLYSPSSIYETPDVMLKPQPGRIYQFLACGETGSFGRNCGLFPVMTSADVEAATAAAEQQIRQSQMVLQAASQQKDIFNQEATQLLKTAKEFVAGLTCIQ